MDDGFVLGIPQKDGANGTRTRMVQMSPTFQLSNHVFFFALGVIELVDKLISPARDMQTALERSGISNRRYGLI